MALKDDVLGQGEKIQELLRAINNKENEIFELKSRNDAEIFELKQEMMQKDLEGKLQVEQIRKRHKYKDDQLQKCKDQISMNQREINDLRIKIENSNEQKN